MEQLIVFGAGGNGQRYVKDIIERETANVIAFLDNNKVKQGTRIYGIEVLPPEEILELQYDAVEIMTAPDSEEEILEQLVGLGVPGERIRIRTALATGGRSENVRKRWLTDFANIVYARDMRGNVAEAGVFRGDFARCINTSFPDRTLYLFDTFQGFLAEDVAREKLASNSQPGYYAETSEQLVLDKLPHPKKAVICKGYFPITAEGIDDSFVFANLDLDLYEPTYNGLKYFWDKVVAGGVLLVHDYFSIDFPNVKTAVADFEHDLGKRLSMVPIGDSLSVGIIKADVSEG